MPCDFVYGTVVSEEPTGLSWEHLRGGQNHTALCPVGQKCDARLTLITALFQAFLAALDINFTVHYSILVLNRCTRRTKGRVYDAVVYVERRFSNQ